MAIRRHLLTAAVLLLLPCVPQPLMAMDTEDCLTCHGRSDIASQGHYIDKVRFEATAHAVLGCPTCHDTIADQHPADGLEVKRARCRDCHEQIAAEYARSPHGVNATCGDCHEPHTVQSPPEVSGFAMNQPCAKCHSFSETAATHRHWLPQTATHLQSLPCITCHADAEGFVLVFYLIPRAQEDFRPLSDKQLREHFGEDIRALAAPGQDPSISLQALRTFRENTGSELRLQGMLVPEQVPHTFDSIESRWDCSFCHVSGQGLSAASYLALPQPGGSFRRIPVEGGAVRGTLYGTPDFYLIGAGRNRNLDLVGALVLCAGLALPLGHGLLRLLTSGRRRRQQQG